MGSNWSWPCGERERRRYRVTTNKPRAFKRPENNEEAFLDTAPFQVSLTRGPRLDRTLRMALGDHTPSYVVAHPSSLEEAIVILQLPSEVSTFEPVPGTYFVLNFSLSGDSTEQWCEMLENNLQNANEVGQTFIGSAADSSGGFYFCFFKPDDQVPSESRILVKPLNQEMSARSLREFLNEQSEFFFRGCIAYQGEHLLVFEEFFTAKSLSYYVVEIPSGDVDDLGYREKLARRIEKCVTKQSLDFTALVSTRRSLYLVLSMQE